MCAAISSVGIRLCRRHRADDVAEFIDTDVVGVLTHQPPDQADHWVLETGNAGGGAQLFQDIKVIDQ